MNPINPEIVQMQMEKMFNTAEAPIKKWVAKFLAKEATDLFDDVGEAEPVTYECQSGSKKGKILHMKLGFVPTGYKSKAIEMKEDRIVETVKFFKYCVSQVYPVVVKTMEEEAPKAYMSTFDPVWDVNTGTWQLAYYPQDMRKYHFIEHQLCTLINANKNVQDDVEVEMKEASSEERAKVVAERCAGFTKKTSELAPELKKYQDIIDSDEFKQTTSIANEKIKSFNRIGIIVKYYTKQELMGQRAKLMGFGKSAFDN